MNKEEKVVVGWIDNGTIHSGFAAHLAQILLHRSDVIESVVATSGAYLSENRNSMVNTFLKNTSADWLLSIDTDVCVEIESFDAVLELADKDLRPIVGGKYYVYLEDGMHVAASTWNMRKPGTYEWITRFDTPIPVENIHAVGLGFALIHRSVFENIAARYPEHPFPWFNDEWRAAQNSWVSDDIFFFERVHEDGPVNVTLCTAATSQHLKTFKLNDQTYLRSVPQHNHNHVDTGTRKKISWWAKGKDHRR